MKAGITCSEELKMAIANLEKRQAEEWPLLKMEFHETMESLKPKNLLKSTFREFTESPDFTNNIFGSLLGLTTGHLTGKLVGGGSQNFLRRVLGTITGFGVSNVVANHSGTIRQAFGSISRLFSGNNTPEKEAEK